MKFLAYPCALMLTFVLIACQSGSNGAASSSANTGNTSGSNDNARAVERDAAGKSRAEIDAESKKLAEARNVTTGGPSAQYGTIQNARVICYQPRTTTRLTMVNINHQERRSREGRRRLASGVENVGYKVLTDRSIDALLESFRKYKSESIREAWRPDMRRYLTAKSDRASEVRGIIVVENRGQTYAYLGRKPRGPNDVLGQSRYKVFTDLKKLVLHWYNSTSALERIGTAGIGNSNTDQLAVPIRKN